MERSNQLDQVLSAAATNSYHACPKLQGTNQQDLQFLDSMNAGKQSFFFHGVGEMIDLNK